MSFKPKLTLHPSRWLYYNSLNFNNIVGDSNYSYLIDRINEFIKAFRPKKHLFKTILVEYHLLKTTILPIASIFFNKSIVDE
jgi:hypothetical protein